MHRKALVGMLLLGALLIFALATFYIENWQFYLQEGYQIRARFPSVEGLDEGEVVRMAGVVVGKVARISVETEEDTTEPVRVTLWIEEGVKVRADDAAEVRTVSLFGGRYVAIVRGDPTAPELKSGDRIRKSSVQPGIPEMVAASEGLLAQARESVDKLNRVIGKVEQGEGTLGKLVSDEEAYKELEAALSDARETFAQLKDTARQASEGKGLMARLLTDQKLAEDVQVAASDVRQFSADLKAVSADMRAGKGTLGKLLTDETAYQDLKNTLTEGREAFAGLSEVAVKAREGKGALAKLLTDEQLAARLDTIADDLQATAANLRESSARLEPALAEGKGTLGKLLTDDALYQKITTTVDSLQAMIEDYREQSPMITFAGSVFGAF